MARSTRRRAGVATAVGASIAGATGVALPFFQVYLARRGPKPKPRALSLNARFKHEDAARALRVVWLGDSLAAGVGAEQPADSLPHQVATLLGVPASVEVLARSGARVDDVVTGQLPRLAELRQPPDLIIVSVGANDVSARTRRRDFVARYTQMLDVTASAAAQVVVLGVPDMSSALVLAQPLRMIVGLRARIVDRWISATVSKHAENVRYIDITAHEKVPRRRVAEYLSADRYHPNGLGYRVWAGLVADELRTIVASLPGRATRPGLA